MSELTLEVGKTYLDRFNNKYLVIHDIRTKESQYDFIAITGGGTPETYMSNGKCYKDNRFCNNDLVSEYIEANDWEVDTKLVVTHIDGFTYKRHFSHISNGNVYCFNGGRTSFTKNNSNTTLCKNYRLATEEDM